jgi:MAC/Perforin domain
MASVYIPGAASLGYGFDVFGSYSDSSKTRPLFNMVYDQGGQTYKDYLVPLNVNVDQSSRNYGDSTYVDTRRKIEEYFSANLKVTAKYGFFSGQFEASYSMTNKSDVSYQFGIVEAYSQQFALDLKDRSEAALAPWVKDDPDYKSIPNQFTDKDRILFFRFFDKYGIYYMPRVVVGSRLYYSSQIRKEYKYSAVDAQAKLKLEYKAVFGASAETQATWKQVGETWASQREVKVDAVGGSNEILNVLMPGYGANHENAYAAWLNSAEANPAVVDFDLKPISEIFSADKAAAVQQAINAYVLHKLFVESKTGSCLIAFNGAPVLPQPTGESPVVGWQIAAIHRTQLKSAFARSYTTSNYWIYEEIYDRMLADIQPYNNPNYIIAFTAYSNFAQNAPTKAFTGFLESCGAGYKLAQWLDTKASNNGIYKSCVLAHINYAFVGMPGAGKGKGHEDFQRAGSCDTDGGGANWSYLDPWLDKPAPMASLMVDLYQVQGTTSDELVLEIGKARKG